MQVLLGDGRRLAGEPRGGKVASGGRRRHHRAMRRLLLLAPALFLAACGTAPQTPPQVTAPAHIPPERGDLIGLTVSELIQRFGAPALQIHEGTSLKLQFRGRQCILDAYLYPPADGRAGVERVMHVDSRVSSGADTDQRSCIATLQGA
jgi:hypothetical protein